MIGQRKVHMAITRYLEVCSYITRTMVRLLASLGKYVLNTHLRASTAINLTPTHALVHALARVCFVIVTYLFQMRSM
jgi:hypothetical protein